MFQRFNLIIFTILLMILIVVPVISQDQIAQVTLSPSPTLSPSFTPSMTPSETPSITPSSTEIMLEFTATPSPSPSETQAEVTAELSPEVTEISTDFTETAAPETSSEVTAEATEAIAETEEVVATETVERTEAVEVTEAVEETEAVTEAVTESMATVTATPGAYVLKVLRGQVRYQNRAEQTGISVAVLTLDGVLLSLTETNARGVFSIAAPAEVSFVLLIEAPLHRSLRLNMNPDEELPRLVLAGGDLNGDSCINHADMDLLLGNYERENSPISDINANGITDLSDLAILTGNFDGSCGVVAESTQEAQ